ncbi:hypothetical protein GY45DRAFT_158626 [Cubamyces sp. BRFM 1775]|nr:hypothetical protein GY45DRAFT_158626 [Cubamyces sp. BRFM 1775]
MSPDSCVYNVPMDINSRTLRTSGLDPLLAMSRNRSHIQEARRFTLGPMPVPIFLDTFLPTDGVIERDCSSLIDAFEAVPRCADKPAMIYEPLCSALAKLCPGFAFDKSIERCIRPSRLGHVKPHISCFARENLPHIQQADPALRLEFGYAELFKQCTSKPSVDFWVDPPPGANVQGLATHDFAQRFDDDEQRTEAMRTFGSHIAFATEVFARQHRVFLYTISVAGSSARFFRWDRSRCVVTEAFDIHEQPEAFADFLWRFSKLSDAKRPSHLFLVVVLFSCYPGSRVPMMDRRNAFTSSDRVLPYDTQGGCSGGSD